MFEAHFAHEYKGLRAEGFSVFAGYIRFIFVRLVFLSVLSAFISGDIFLVSFLLMSMLHEIVDGRTDLVFDYLAAGHPTNSTDENSVSPLKWCAYYGDVSAIKFLLSKGESLQSLGDDLSLNVACFHGHWRLCKFLLENGADANRPAPDIGETPLHSAVCKPWPQAALVVKVLLAHGAKRCDKTLS